MSTVLFVHPHVSLYIKKKTNKQVFVKVMDLNRTDSHEPLMDHILKTKSFLLCSH